MKLIINNLLSQTVILARQELRFWGPWVEADSAAAAYPLRAAARAPWDAFLSITTQARRRAVKKSVADASQMRELASRASILYTRSSIIGCHASHGFRRYLRLPSCFIRQAQLELELKPYSFR